MFDDEVCGPQHCNVARELGDFPITQKVGSAAYQLAVVVDDAEMGVTDVVRGDDLIPSTFRQIELFRALGWQIPTFAHVPLVCGSDGRRLAKRHGDTRLSHYRERGIAAEVVVGWAAHSAGLVDRCDPIAAKELVTEFDWKKLSRDPVIVDQATWPRV